MTRTTIAATTLAGSPGHNVLATRAEAGLNIRVMPGDTVEGVLRHLRKAIRDREVTVEVVHAGEPSPISPFGEDDEPWRLLEATIAHHFPEAICSPYLMMGATDSRFFTTISDHVYRFAPFRMSAEQRASVHSYDEHIHVDDLVHGVAWYRSLIERIA